MNNTTNFWNVMSNYQIEIPIIQRDYAQGRTTTKINEIRKNILENIYIALTENKILEFDFVYGNKKNNGYSKKFIPLDGQQRLTTLFLLHWYIAFKEQKYEESKIMDGFTYETRISSREFCNALVEHIADFSIKPNMTLKETICNQSWYYLSWMKDPTIKAMLQTLNDIHEKFHSISPVWNVLTSTESCPIVFRFIELEHFGLEDDLYIKMNARGKALTDFEYFKSKFEQLLEQKFPTERKYFETKIDGAWTDLFWYPPQNADFDSKYLNFFKAVAKNNYALKMDPSSKTQSKFSSKIENITDLVTLFDENIIRDIKILDLLLNSSGELTNEFNNKRLNLEELFAKITNDTATYSESIMFYALSRFLLKNFTKAKGVDKNALNNWIRVIYNLVVNTEYDEEIEFARSIKTIDTMIPFSSSILDYLANSRNSIVGFNTIQIEEERIKSILIKKSSDWESLLLKYEYHGYFKGQIIFILSFSGIQGYYKKDNTLNWSQENDSLYMKIFNDYATKLEKVFSEKGLILKDYIWERALFCKGFYPIGKNQKYSLLKDFDRDYSWKRLLRDNEKNMCVKAVLDCVSCDTLQDDLSNIISNNNVTDLRKYFIAEPSLIDACRSRYFQKFEDTYLLLKTSITAGYHKELRSYNLFLKVNKLCGEKKNTYEDNRGIDSIKSITRINNHIMEIHYKNKKFEMTYPEVHDFKNENEVIQWLHNSNILL